MGGSVKAPEPTAEQTAMEKRQRMQLQEETAASERRLKAIARKKVGKASLLGMPLQQADAPEAPTVTAGYTQTSGGRVKKLTKGLFSKIANKSILGGRI
jgi:hypothetical protein